MEDRAGRGGGTVKTELPALQLRSYGEKTRRGQTSEADGCSFHLHFHLQAQRMCRTAFTARYGPVSDALLDELVAARLED